MCVRVLQVLGVEGGSLLLGGADVVDGSPVLDIKPYVAFCDSVPGATAPAWVKVSVTQCHWFGGVRIWWGCAGAGRCCCLLPATARGHST